MSEKTAEQRVLDSQAWADFCDALKEAGKLLDAPKAPQDIFNRAEGYRYLTRMLRADQRARSGRQQSTPGGPVFPLQARHQFRRGQHVLDRPDTLAAAPDVLPGLGAGIAPRAEIH